MAKRTHPINFKSFVSERTGVRFIVQPWFSYIGSNPPKIRVTFPVIALKKYSLSYVRFRTNLTHIFIFAYFEGHTFTPSSYCIIRAEESFSSLVHVVPPDPGPNIEWR